jgi:putative transposase
VTIDCAVSIGEVFVFSSDNPARAYELRERKPTGKLVFRSAEGQKRTIDPREFTRMRGEGRATRITKTGATQLGLTPRHINPPVLQASLAGPIPDSKKREIEAERNKLEESRTLYFYIRKMASEQFSSLHQPVVQRFINDHYPEAQADGLFWKPSPSALARVLRKHGGNAERISLSAIYDTRRGQDPAQRWDPPVVKMRRKVIDFYWSDREPSYTPMEAKAFFFAPLIRLNRRREKIGIPKLEVPDPQTVMNWIYGAVSKERLEKRRGKGEARRAIGGRGRPTEASRALEVVLMDNTQVDVWAVVRSPDGVIIDRFRPWLTFAIDAYSRMPLAGYLSEEQASLVSAYECLKQIVRRKDHLIKRFPDCPEAADCWGAVGTLILDNGLDFSALSFRVACEYAGISLRYAPVRTPEYKGIVERAFGTLNSTLWHRMPGGLPGTPQERSRLRKDPRESATFTLEELDHRMWGTLIPIMGMTPHSVTGVAPARRFFESLRKYGRPTVDDVNAFDAILGQTHRCQLSAEGIRFGGHRFHDPEVTAALLEDMLAEASRRDQRKDGSSSSVWVHALGYPNDCSHAVVYNTRRKELVRLPNWDDTILPKTSFKHAARLKAIEDEKNEAYWPKDDQWIVRDRERRARETKERREKKKTKKVSEEKSRIENFSLVNDMPVDNLTATPSAMGMRPVEIGGSMPVHARTDNLIPPLDPQRGKRKPTSKKVQSVELTSTSTDPKVGVEQNNVEIRRAQFRIDDPVKFMATLRKKV